MRRLAGKRVLITGATGFIGNRLVEQLMLDEGAEVVALVHRFMHASRLGRFQLKMVAGDVTDSEVVRRAMEGCDMVVHAAIGTTGDAAHRHRVTVDGTRNVCEAALLAGVSRVVCLSTISVYGKTADGPLTEDAPKKPDGDAYGVAKLLAERCVQEYQVRGLPATILQPTIVYGPWSYWSTHAAQQLRDGIVLLPDGGRGLCNAVYVDDVIEAILLSLCNAMVLPGPYLISGQQAVTWRDYYLAHTGGMKDAVIETMSAAETRSFEQPMLTSAYWKRIFPARLRVHAGTIMRELPVVSSFYRRLKGESKLRQGVAGPIAKPRLLPQPEHYALFAGNTEVRITRAEKDLGYKPKFDLLRGREIIGQWLSWAAISQ